VIGDNPVGVLDENLHAACMGALRVSREACRAFALTRSWETSARQFIGHVENVKIGTSRKSQSRWAIETARG
jgi:hypothetical protein